ncbi:MAG: glycerate kinase [Candidatus Carbobacillus sp.]|nr:glycerate kinase [Candidatus Carbobacillus sp.]
MQNASIPPVSHQPCFLVAPDAFKGTLTPMEAAQAMAQGLSEVYPHARILLHPLTDGGEGTLDVLLAHRHGTLKTVQAHDPKGRLRRVEVGLFEEETTTWAIIESARIIGYTLIDDHPRRPLTYHTRGLGELVRMLIDEGMRHIIVTLGGSATTDAGLGFLSALGAKLWDADGKTLYGRAEDVCSIARVDLTPLRVALADRTLIAWTDVTAPFCGKDGAVYTFGPQKGLLTADVERLDEAFCRLPTLPGMPPNSADDAQKEGSGAAGGLGWAMCLSGGSLRSGSDEVARWTGFHEKLAMCDVVLTGEGKSDEQTLRGKVPFYVARHARAAGKKVVLLSGQLGAGWEALKAYVDEIYSVSGGEHVERKDRAAELLRQATASWAHEAFHEGG